MTLEQKIQIMKELKNKELLCIGPNKESNGVSCKGKITLIKDYNDLELYEKMAENTEKMAEKAIVMLISDAETANRENKKTFRFLLIYYGNQTDLPANDFPIADFIANYSDKIIVEYLYEREINCEHRYLTERVYLSLSLLLRIFEKHNIRFEISDNLQSYDGDYTYFTASYNPNCMLSENQEHKLTME